MVRQKDPCRRPPGKGAEPVRLHRRCYAGLCGGRCTVCHVDASKGIVAWGKDNAAASGLADRPIRWLVDDCAKFVARESAAATPTTHHHGPPSYGRGLAITDIMMVATAMNERQVIGVAEEVEKDVYLKCGHLSPRSREGVDEGQWVLLDYGDFIIHIMHQDAREYYRLERLWRDCPVVELPLEHPETTGDESADNGSDGDDAGEADE